MTIWRMRFACRITKVTDTHSNILILIAFFTAIMVTRTRLRLTFIGMPVVLLTWGVYGDGIFFKRHCRVAGSVLCSSLISAVPVTSSIFPLPFVSCEVPGVLHDPVSTVRRTDKYVL
jgi:hypothetical protein